LTYFFSKAAAEVQSRAYYWNEEFQTISEKIRGVDLYDEEPEYISMANLYNDFEHVVRVYTHPPPPPIIFIPAFGSSCFLSPLFAP
jgi:hypothetical protein